MLPDTPMYSVRGQVDVLRTEEQETQQAKQKAHDLKQQKQQKQKERDEFAASHAQKAEFKVKITRERNSTVRSEIRTEHITSLR